MLSRVQETPKLGLERTNKLLWRGTLATALKFIAKEFLMQIFKFNVLCREGSYNIETLPTFYK